LSANSISGVIPESIGNLVDLEILYLATNEMAGFLPSTLGKLKKLKSFSMAYNKNTGGSVAPLAGCTNLESIGLFLTSFFGSIESLSALKNLKSLYYFIKI
jgi:Leucine-rich repeat (LRR) protein